MANAAGLSVVYPLTVEETRPELVCPLGLGEVTKPDTLEAYKSDDGLPVATEPYETVAFASASSCLATVETVAGLTVLFDPDEPVTV